MKALVTTILVALVLSPMAGARMEVQCDDATRYASEAHRIHNDWIIYIESGRATPEQVKTGGNVEWHKEWVRRYDVIIDAVKERCH